MQPTDLPVMTSAVAALLREVPCPNCIVWGKFDELALALRQAVPGQSVGYVVMNETAEVRWAREGGLCGEDATCCFDICWKVWFKGATRCRAHTARLPLASRWW